VLTTVDNSIDTRDGRTFVRFVDVRSGYERVVVNVSAVRMSE